MAAEDVGETFFLKHFEGFAEAIEEGGGRSVGEEAGTIGAQHLLPVPVGSGQFCRLIRCKCLFGDGIEAQAGGHHEAFLRAGDGDIDAPRFVTVVDGAKRGDGVHHQEGWMPKLVDGFANFGDRGGDAGRGLVVDDHDGFDGLLPVRG